MIEIPMIIDVAYLWGASCYRKRDKLWPDGPQFMLLCRLNLYPRGRLSPVSFFPSSFLSLLCVILTTFHMQRISGIKTKNRVLVVETGGGVMCESLGTWLRLLRETNMDVAQACTHLHKTTSILYISTPVSTPGGCRGSFMVTFA